jgi:anti-sigma regulatory factor (Ser/Thr protein kinase)
MNVEDRQARQATYPSFSLQLRIPPLPSYARSARAALGAFAHYHCVGARDVENLTFALGEALSNAMQHAQTQDDIAIGFAVDGTAIVATVHDHGQGFGNTNLRAASLPAEASETGRGFAIMQRCTDFFNVRSTPGEGTIVTLGRYLNH